MEPAPWVAAPKAHGHGRLARARREQRLTKREPPGGRRRVGADEHAMARAVPEHVLLPADWDRLVRLREMLLPGERVTGRARPQRRLFSRRGGVLHASR